MRRGLAFVSLSLLLVGLELSTEAITLVAERVTGGISALFGGTESDPGGFRFGAGLVVLAVGLGLWTLLIWSGRKRRDGATEGGVCPRCGIATRRVRRRGWQRVLAGLLGEHVTRRKCEKCGWVGLSVRR